MNRIGSFSSLLLEGIKVLERIKVTERMSELHHLDITDMDPVNMDNAFSSAIVHAMHFL